MAVLMLMLILNGCALLESKSESKSQEPKLKGRVFAGASWKILHPQDRAIRSDGLGFAENKYEPVFRVGTHGRWFA